MRQRRNIKREIIEALTAHPDGMTMVEIADHIQSQYENVRTTLQRARPAGVYISEWVSNAKGPLSALYKVISVPVDAEKPAKRTDAEKREANARHQANHRARKAAQFETQGLTQIRGPWPTHH